MDQTPLKHQPNLPSEPSQISEEVIALTPDLLAHPLFLRTDDKILTTFIESLKSIIVPVPDTLKLQTHKTNFETYLKETMQDGRPPQQLFEDLHKANISSTTTCSKSITPNELYFRCLDCEVITDPSQISHMCQDCFHNSHHDGHRILKGKPLSPCTCDCGRSQNLSEAGFCPNHKAQDQTVEEILADFPKIIRSQITEVFRKAIYGIICLFEIEEKAKGKKTKTIINALARSFTDQLLGYYLFLVQRVSRLFNLVIERLFQSSFEAPNNLVWHDCSDLKDENQNKNCELGQPTQCTCTVLGCLLRFSKFFGAPLQGKLNIIFMESCKEKSSKQFLNKELIKHVYFIVGDPLSSTGDFKKVNSKQSELLTNELSITENDIGSLDHFLGALKRVFSDFSDPDSDKYLEILCFQAPLEKFIVQDSKTSLRVLQETDLFSKLLNLLSDFHANMVQPQTIKLEIADQMIDYGFFSVTLSAERYMCSSLDHAFKKLGDLESEDKDSLFRGIAKTWYDCYRKTQSKLVEQRTAKGKTSFQAGLERALCLMMVHYVQNNITQERVEGFLKKVFPEVDSSSVASDAVSGVLASLGLIRFTDVIKTPATRSMNGYYYNLLSIFETDIVLIQAMTLFINPQDIFSLFVKNFFSYSKELQEFCLSFGPVQNVINHPYSRKMILAVEDFLNFIAFFMNDEICLVNLNSRKDLGRKPDNSVIERAIKKLLVNILVQKGWIDINSIKSLVSLFVFEEAQDCTDNVISKITTRDETTNKVKLKEEYEKDIDLNVFFKHYNGQREEHNKLTRAGGNSETCDIISGAFYSDLPEYMVELHHNIFQSQLSEFVCHILTNFCKELSHLVQPALRLVLFNLQVLAKSLDKPNSKTEGLQKKVEATYLKESFITTLNGIQASGDFKECEASIMNIKSLIKQLSPQLLPKSVKESLSEDPKENLEEEKNKQAKEKMEKVKEEFANKQALFAEKNDHCKQDSNLAEKSGLVCQCCLDKIQEVSGEEYGVPIYIEFTNNFYNTEEEVVFTEQDYSAWWPVVSSCNHFYHKRCFETHFQNSRGPQNVASKLFINEYETQCALCKSLCNNFLVVNNDFGKEGSSEKYCQDFVKKIQNIMVHLKENLLVFNPEKVKDQNNDICSEEIFKRSYEYLIESFHLHEKAQSLEATFKLYTIFFKVFKGYLETNQHHSLDSKSLLQTLVENHNRTENEKVYLELKVERILFNLLQEDELTVNEYVRVIKEYVLVSLVNFARLERPDKATSFEDFIVLYKENKEFRDKIVSELSFPLQKILLAYYFNRSVLHSNSSPEVTDFCEIICSSHDNNQKIDLLLKHAQLSLTFEQLIEDSLSLLPTLIKSEKDLLNSLLDCQTPSLKIVKLKLAPRFVELPQNYLEFSQKCTTKRCNVCKGHSPRLIQTICLICGESMCGVVCAGGPGPGNLSKHAIQHHFGLGLFYCIDNHSLIAIKYNVGLYFSLGNGYTDEQGRPFKVLLAQNDFDTIGIKKDLDFKRFVLDKKVRDFLREVVTHHSVGQQIFENVFKNPTGYTNTHTF